MVSFVSFCTLGLVWSAAAPVRKPSAAKLAALTTCQTLGRKPKTESTAFLTELRSLSITEVCILLALLLDESAPWGKWGFIIKLDKKIICELIILRTYTKKSILVSRID